ncbi:hypothetical protein [Kordiimonas marina]|uniref:hypothetical protein n=1 Tax=Kordiimonas marina TaxID=2872312 RepID=UPI001FF5A810|nr:hypothetical protein [Kordiimonas marina]MCJ9428570.1 hypothetical protein [Kordiimonas marina]
MSKRKATKVFRVYGADASIIVIARHAKGARTLAAQEMPGVTARSTVELLEVQAKTRAFNYEKVEADACA